MVNMYNYSCSYTRMTNKIDAQNFINPGNRFSTCAQIIGFKKKIRWPRRKNFTSWNNWNIEIFTRTLIGPNPGRDILKERIKQKIESVHSSRSSDWDQRECSRKMKGGIDLRRKISAYHRYLYQIIKKR